MGLFQVTQVSSSAISLRMVAELILPGIFSAMALELTGSAVAT